MNSLEYRCESSLAAKEELSSQMFVMFDRLNNKITEDKGKIIAGTTIKRNFFEENGVRNEICKSLFGNKVDRDFLIYAKPKSISIGAFDSKEGFKNIKASIMFFSDGSNFVSRSFIAEDEHGNQPELKPKAVAIEITDCQNILSTIYKIATGQRLIK